MMTERPLLTLIIFFLFAVLPGGTVALAQDAGSGLIRDLPQGRFTLQAQVEFRQADASSYAQPRAYFWKQTEESGKPVTVGKGAISYIRDGEERFSRYEIKGTELFLHFESPEGKKSYTAYQYELIPGGFRISREDPYIAESYTFSLE